MRNRIIGGVVALALVVTMVNLGLWQLRRHSEKQQLADRVESRIDIEPVGLQELYEEAVLSGGGGLLVGEDGLKQVEYRRVADEGKFICEQEVLIRNRTLDGRPGYWVFTPFAVLEEGWEAALEDDEESEDISVDSLELLAPYIVTTYIVNRGWLPLELAPDRLLPPLNPNSCNTDGVRITGFISLQRGGAAKECESLSPTCTFAHPDINAIASHFSSLADNPLVVRPDFYIQMARSQPPSDGTPVAIDTPSFDTGNHFSYAVQWFIFGTIAAVGYFLIFWRKANFWRRGRKSA